MAVRRLALEPAQVGGHVDGISFEHPEWIPPETQKTLDMLLKSIVGY